MEKRQYGINNNNKDIKLHYNNSNAYAFILSNRANNSSKTKAVEVTLVHTWQQEIKESQLKIYNTNDPKI